jgi:outer membrane protein assembly factor BamA
MIVGNKNILFSSFWLLVIVMTGCSVTKKLPAGESLYTGAMVKVVADSTIAQTEVKNIEAQLNEFVKPNPNSTLLGFPYKVWFYYLFGEPKNEKGFKSFFRKRFGEPPVLASKSVTGANAKQINILLNNEGYFRSNAIGELIEKNRKAKAIYITKLHPRYYLDSVVFRGDTTLFGKSFVSSQQNSLLKKGLPYRFDVISAERIRIDNALKKQGFYYFQPDFIIIKADSSQRNHTVNLSVEIKPSTSQIARKVYRIRNVNVLTDFNDRNDNDSTDNQNIGLNYRGLHIIDRTDSYKPKIFAQAIGFRHGSRYSSSVQDLSLSRLINLNNNFKFVKNSFTLVPRSDSALLDVNYYLTPLKAKSVVAELSGVTKSNDFTGTNLGISWVNKNTFRGAELLKITASAGLDFQVGGASVTLGAINTSKFSIAANLSIPRFIIPFFRVNSAKNQALPKTNITTSYEIRRVGDLYSQTSFITTMGYAWKQNNNIEHSLNPISINLVKGDFTEAFQTEVFRSDNPRALLNTLDNTIIMSSGYTFTYNPTSAIAKRGQFRFTGGVEIAGNFAGLLSKIAAKTSDDEGKLFNVTYAQYLRLDADLRYTYTINQGLNLANRFVVGYGLPYGNSQSLPPTKQYSAGGNNSIRAFTARSIGPGNYFSSDGVNNVVLGSQTGDIRLELNTELRMKFNKYVNGAFFIDAGNVWTQKNIDDYGEGALFGSDFYKQIAIGTGIGLRLDFSYLVLRFDLATPVRKPFLPENERWVLKNFNLKDPQWRSDNLILNIAVGYPF